MNARPNRWGWHAAATRLLLAPVAVATLATAAPGQAPAARSDPKVLLKQSREALKAGRFDQATELAKRADAVNGSARWGLFDDTPESVEKDVARARAKAGRAESERLARAAKELYARPAKTPGERVANLDQAFALADKAMALAGPADFFDDLFGNSDRPEKLKKDIDTARAAVRKANPGVLTAAKPAPGATQGMTVGQTVVTQAKASGTPSQMSRVTAAGVVIPPPNMPSLTKAMSDADREANAKLVAAGRELLKAGRFAEAKAVALKAQAMKVASTTGDNADALMRDVVAAGKDKVDKLVAEADKLAGTPDAPKADAMLAEAKGIAADMGFSVQAIEVKAAKVKAAASELMTAVTAPVTPNEVASLGGIVAPIVPPMSAPDAPKSAVAPPSLALTVPEMPKPAATDPAAPNGLPPIGLPPIGLPTPPEMPKVAEAPKAPKAPETPSNVLTGTQLLGQARSSLKSGDLEMAKVLVVRGFNSPGVNKDEASALLREIDAEAYGRTRSEAQATFANAARAFQSKQYDQAAATLKLIDPSALTTEQRAQLDQMRKTASEEVAKLRPVQSTSTPAKPLTESGSPTPVETAKAAADIERGKLRSEALDVEAKAREAYARGETDLSIQMMTDFLAKVQASNLSTAYKAQVSAPVERRLETARIMKRQTDFYASEAKGKIESRDRVVGKQMAMSQKADELKKKSLEVAELSKQKKFREAEELALQMKSLAPDDPQVLAMYEMAKRQRRADSALRQSNNNEQFILDGLNAAEHLGSPITDGQPLVVDPARALIARKRGDGMELYAKPMTPIEREIEVKLERPLTIEFKNVSLRDAVEAVRKETGLNITTDDASLNESLINTSAVMVNETMRDLSVRNILNIVLDKARLKFVVEHNAVRVTTEKRAQGKLITKVFSVMELVTPVPDFALADHQSITKALAKNTPKPSWTPTGPGQSTYNPTGGLPNGATLTSGQLPNQATLDSSGGGSNVNSPLASSATLAANGRTNTSEQLKKLITAVVRPYSWQDGGGTGKIEYYDLGAALVVNQTADVIGEVQQLLESLRRLQEVSVSVEIRVVSLSESFFERIGVDFSLNVKTKGTANFERQLTTGQFRPEPYINDININNVTVGYNPTAGGFTPDLDFPVRPNTFGFGVPPFGGYPGAGNGGLSLGLAFLNDIQVFMFMEAAAGDRRVNIMQAPKITLFNGQTSTVFVSDFAFFTTGLDIINVGGQVVYIPRNTPIPIGNSPAPPGVQAGQALPGVTVTVQAIVSADRRFVRLNLAPTLTSLTSATVPLFPVTAFITPVFEGGSQGVPIPFTQFFQQPSISEINVQTTVAVPDGGTVVLGGLKTLAEGRNEFGPPVLSQLPYVNRLFRNQGIGRETRHIMIMVTPRIIIQSEEELNQTGGGLGLIP